MTQPRFIPFEAMTTAQQIEHMARMHSVTDALDRPPLWLHQTDHAFDHMPGGCSRYIGVTLHTHDKRTEENR